MLGGPCAHDAYSGSTEKLSGGELTGRGSGTCQDSGLAHGWVATAHEQETATPNSSASGDTEASAVEAHAPAAQAAAPTAPVKNTFIHYDLPEQPDYRSCVSGPAHLSRMFEPAFVPLSRTMQKVEEQEFAPPLEAAEQPPPPAHEPPPPTPPPRGLPPLPPRDAAATLGSFLAAPQTPQSPQESPMFGATIKNTFIHFELEEAEQPDYRPTKSGPAKLLRTTSPQEPAWIPFVEEKAARNAQEHPETPTGGFTGGVRELPSRGSVGHAVGKCKPCAHNWKRGGCSKGYDCSFCHLCEEDDFRRRRREKLVRLKAEKAMRKVAEEHSEDSHDEQERASASRNDGRQSPLSPAQPRHDQGLIGTEELAPGELTVSYSGNAASVRWAVDLNKLRSQHRCGQSRRFALTFGARKEVPFVFFISPSTTESVEVASTSGHGKTTSFKRSQATAVMQLKCSDAAALAEEGALMSVSFAAGSLPARKASTAHDFAAEPVCALLAHEAAWDLAAAAGQVAACCVLRAELEILVNG